jgi:hypothetical protein
VIKYFGNEGLKYWWTFSGGRKGFTPGWGRDVTIAWKPKGDKPRVTGRIRDHIKSKTPGAT